LERAGALARTVWNRLESHGFRGFRTVTVTVRFANFITFARSRTGREAWTSEEALWAAALELLLPFLDDRGNPRHRKLRRLAVLEEGDDPAQLQSAIVHAHAGSLRELPPQQRRQRLDPGFDRVDAHPQRVTGGDAQADLAGHEALPVFEPARVVTDDVGVGVDPGGGVEIDERRLEPPDGVAPHVEEARAAGPAQILAARGLEQGTGDLPQVH